MCVCMWYNYGGPSEFIKTMERMYTLASQLGTFNIIHTQSEMGDYYPLVVSFFITLILFPTL